MLHYVSVLGCTTVKALFEIEALYEEKEAETPEITTECTCEAAK